MTFVVKMTYAGLDLLAAAAYGATTVQLTHMAVGDGNGNPIDPATLESATALVREVYRHQMSSLTLDPSDSTIVVGELAIPTDVGNFAIREVGVFTSDGVLFAYGNHPDTYKPVATEGSTREMVIKVAMKVGNADTVTLVVDTSIVLATRDWVLNNITAANLIPGGLAGQVLVKDTNADGDFDWADPTAAVNVAVDVIEETQTAAAAQTVFDLATMTTDGTAVYVEGVRLIKDTDYTVTTATRITLATAPITGAKVTFTQNEPNAPLELRKTIMSRVFFVGQI